MKNLLNRISFLYKISGINDTEKIDKGFLSENHKIVTSDGEFFLKKYRFKDERRIKEIHSVKKYFSEGDIPVIMPIKTKENKTYFEHDGGYFALFPFVTGIQPERGELTRGMIVSLGEMLGKIHLRGKDSNLVVDDYFNAWNKEQALKTAEEIEDKLDQIESKNEFDLLAQKVVAFKKDLINQSDVKFEDLNLKNNHLIHGDYLDFNVFFDENGKVKYVFDFEKTSYEPRTQELFRSATYSFLNTDFDSKSIENIQLYLESYLEVYPMKEEELKNGLMVHYLKSMHGFWVEKEHYLKDSDRVDLFLELNYKRLKFMSERLEDLLQ